MMDGKNRRLVDQAKESSSSLISLRDSASFHSSRTQLTERSSLWNRAFQLDRYIIGSEVYQKQSRSLMKYDFRRRGCLDSTEASSAVDYHLWTDQDHERKISHKKIAPPLVVLLGPDERGKIMFLNSFQWYHDEI